MLHVALVGAGGMAALYRKVYSTLPDVEFSLAIDLDDAQLAACTALGAKKVSKNFADALSPWIDMVDISTPNFLHEEQAVAALEAGKHVLLQKPMSNALDAADRILAAAGKSRGALGMYMSAYTNPLVWEIKKIVEGGHLGKIQSIRARDAHRGGLRAQPTDRNWRGSRDKTGGGSFVQLSIHAINLMQWWLGAKITDVFAFSQNQYCKNIGGDDVTVCAARFDVGYFGLFDSGWASDGMSREIYGTEGNLRLYRDDKELELTLDRPYQSNLISYDIPGKPKIIPCPPWTFDDTNNPFNQQRMFVEAIRNNRKPHMPGETGRQDLAVVTAAYRSAETGKPEKCS